jgi:hypothetical protein
MKKRINLSEASKNESAQDGFFVWLLQWATPAYREYDEKLNDCAKDFVRFLMKTHSEEDLEIEEVNVGRKRDNIDIWAKINDKYLIIIKKQIFVHEHLNQLEWYEERTKKWYKGEDLKLIFICLKIESEFSTENIKDSGFKYISRYNLIEFFKNYKDIENDIYIFFTEKIKHFEEA